MKAKSIKGKSPEEIKTVLQESMCDGFQPTLALVFISIKQDINRICELLDQKKIAIYGTTTNGEIAGDEITAGAISILLMDIHPAHFKVLFEEYQTKSPLQASQSIATRTMEFFSKPAFFIACSEFRTNFQELLRGFTDIAGEMVEVYGGVAGDDLSDTEQLVFTNDKSSKRGVVAIAFDENRIIIRGKVICGWNPLGTVKTVTKSEKNRIIEIDGESALDITLRYAGIKELPPDYNEAVLLVSRTLAMQFLKDHGDPVTLMGLISTEDGSMITHANILEGTKLRFAVPPDFEVVDEVIEKCQELKSEIPEADAVVVYSCSARFDVLGPVANQEVEEINKIWDAPMAGFFCNGELARAHNGNLEIHNLTACCVVLKEK